MRIAAFDLSLECTGVALYGLGRAVIELGTLKNDRRGMDRLRWIRNQVLLLARGADLVLLEGYAFARANQAHQLGELGGVVRLALFEAGFTVIDVPPSVVKKLATGNGNGKKQDVLLAAVRRLDYDGNSLDEADARWLLEAGFQVAGLSAATRLPHNHLDGEGMKTFRKRFASAFPQAAVA